MRPASILLAAACSASVPLPAAASTPSVVLILADDLGYGDVHALNPTSRLPTPALDRLAEEGMVFTDAHTPSSVCTPTRYGVLTGRYAWRSRLQRGVLFGYSPPLIEPERATLASVLKARGYHTAAFGKWHLGLGWAKKGPKESDVDFTQPIRGGPLALGFDRFHGIPASLDMPPYVYIEGDRVTELPTERQEAQRFPAFIRRGPRAPGFDPQTTLDHLLEQVLGYLRGRKENGGPFFLYFALTAPHKPVAPAERFRGRSGLGPYGDFVIQVDWTVGRVLEELDRLGLSGQTIVFFTSDNGSFMYRRDDPQARDHVDDPSIQAYRADRHRPNHIFRGTKADIWEAGHRVPLLARWPGRIPAGTRSDMTVVLTDLFATVAELTGASIPDGAAEDSWSFAPVLLGKKRSVPRPPVIHHSVAGMFAIREGPWKLVLGSGSGGREAPRGKPFARPYRLFDLDADPSETSDCIRFHPEVAKRLETAFEEIRAGRKARRTNGKP